MNLEIIKALFTIFTIKQTNYEVNQISRLYKANKSIILMKQQRGQGGFKQNSFHVDFQESMQMASSFMEAQKITSEERQKRIKKLTVINKELIQELKVQNNRLSQHINKHKLKANDSGRAHSLKQQHYDKKESQKLKKQLTNAYRQIDMYKNALQILKAKETSTDIIEKINLKQNQIKLEDAQINEIQKQIKVYRSTKEKQEKDLEVLENQDIKINLKMLEDQTNKLKNQLKNMKKAAQKKDEIQKKQHSYQMELELALRKMNDEYYPGKQQKKQKEEICDVTEAQWNQIKIQVQALKSLHKENMKKADNLGRLKIKELKSYEENQLKLKEKMRKLQTLKNKIVQLAKLSKIRQNKQPPKGLGQQSPLGEVKNESERMIQSLVKAKQKAQMGADAMREVKKWNVPTGYCVQKGKILPNSIFFSDKQKLNDTKKSRVIQVNIWKDSQNAPKIIQLIYNNQEGQKIQGDIPFPVPSYLQLQTWTLNLGDYLFKIQGQFYEGILSSLTLRSKLGKQITVRKDQLSQSGSNQKFIFEPKSNEIPACFFGGYQKINGEPAISHIGCQFIPDW